MLRGPVAWATDTKMIYNGDLRHQAGYRTSTEIVQIVANENLRLENARQAHEII